MPKLKTKKKASYPWDKWLEKGKFTLTRGKEFTAKVTSMTVQTYNAASKRGYKVSIHVDGDKMKVVATKIKGRKKSA